jgi:hypothetical protein
VRPLVFAALKTGLALFLGWVAFVLANVAHLYAWTRLYGTLGAFALVTGFPTFGGAPVSIHMVNVAIWAIPATLAYGGAMRLLFGRPLVWGRLAAVYLLGVGSAAVAANLAASGYLSLPEAVNGFHLVYAVVGLFGVRTWVVR